MQIARTIDSDVHTTSRGFRKATSVHATLTGLGGDCFIIDDPQKPVDAQSEVQRNSLNDWFFNTLMSRLDNKATGSIILVQQRVHLNDLSGHLLENPSDWEQLSLPAIAEDDERILIGQNRFHLRRAGEALHPEREPIEVLEKLQRELGPDIFAAQYQQAPVPPGGAMIRRPWLRSYDKLPERIYHAKIIQSWDTAAKGGAQNSWSVCTTWMFLDGYFYLLDVTRGRFEYPQLRDTAIALAMRYEPNVILIEDASTGVSLAQELRPILPYTIKPIPVHHDKPGRFYVCTGKFASGLVLFPKEAPFMRELLMELLTFPQSKTTDQVDSISQALNYKPSSYDSSMRWVRGDYDDDRAPPAREISAPVHPLAQIRNRRR
jgi:predicted phage terminase large subunit-like protein